MTDLVISSICSLERELDIETVLEAMREQEQERACVLEWNHKQELFRELERLTKLEHLQEQSRAQEERERKRGLEEKKELEQLIQVYVEQMAELEQKDSNYFFMDSIVSFKKAISLFL